MLMVVNVLLFLTMELTVEAIALTFSAFKLKKDMAYFQFPKHTFDFFPERLNFAQFLVMHPDMG